MSRNSILVLKNGRKSAVLGFNPFQLCSYHGHGRYHIWYHERWFDANDILEVHTYDTRDKNERNMQTFCRKLIKLLFLGINPFQLCSCHGHFWYHIWYLERWFDANDIFEVHTYDTRDKNGQNMPTVFQKSWKLLILGLNPFQLCSCHGHFWYHIWYPERWLNANNIFEVHTYQNTWQIWAKHANSLSIIARALPVNIDQSEYTLKYDETSCLG